MRLLPLLLFLACTGRVRDPGLDLPLRVEGGQLVRAPLPEASTGPLVTSIDVRASRVTPGARGEAIGGRTQAGAFAVLLSIEGADWHWLVPTDVESSEVQGELSWSALLDFAPSLAPGPFRVVAQATDASGVPGPAQSVAYEALSFVPEGELVVSLEWDSNADVDLLVKDPNGVVLGGKNINSWSPPPPGGGLPPPDAYLSGGVLDVDSNANCFIDGRRRENAVWKREPPLGAYQAFVAMPQPCQTVGAHFTLTVRRQGEIIAQSSGALDPSDSRSDPTQPHPAPGLLAAEFVLASP